MVKLTIYPNGVKAAKRSRAPQTRGVRGEVSGWSEASARRCDLFLRSIKIEAVLQQGLHGYAFTGTVGYCPADHAAWRRMVKNFLDMLRRRGLVIAHQVTEWQLRGRSGGGPCPHLHGVFFFRQPPVYKPASAGAEIGGGALIVLWLKAVDGHNASPNAQHAVQITDLQGWFRYLAKHAARSVANVQRNPETLPKSWTKTGRMWGVVGDWPTHEFVANMSDKAFYQLRRVSNRLMLDDARRGAERARDRLRDAIGDRQRKERKGLLALAEKRLAYLERRLRKNVEKIGRIVPLSEWLTSDETWRWALACCHDVESVDPETGEVTPYFILKTENDPESLRMNLRQAVLQKGKNDAKDWGGNRRARDAGGLLGTPDRWL